MVFKNFDIDIDHPNLEFRQYYDDTADKMYLDPWHNLSFNKINIYKDLLDETEIDFLWLDLDTYVAGDVTYINNMSSCFVEHGGSVEKPWPLFSNSKQYFVPTNRYIQGNIWKLNGKLYDSLMSTHQTLKAMNLHLRYDLQDLYNYYFYYELNGDVSSTNILGLNSKPDTLNGLGVWDKKRSIGPSEWSVAQLYYDKNKNLRTKLFPEKHIHFVSFVIAQTIHLFNDPNFIYLFFNSYDHQKVSKLADLHQVLIDRPGDVELLNAYFHKAVAASKMDQARAFFNHLQNLHPWNHLIRKLSIAFCLKQEDYPAAMDAIETLVAFSTADDALIDSALNVRAHLPDCQSSTETSISLCLIVRNEQAFLGPCLNSIKNLVNEIIVVDTGSNDRSTDIARIFGARVYHFKWRDDFSAALVYSMEKATGDWILILNADEIIAAQDQIILKKLIKKERKKFKAFSFQTRNYTNLTNGMDWQTNDRSYPQQETGKGWFPTKKVRLFPRYNGIRFEKLVHEPVETSIRKFGMAIEPCPIPIHHYGHLNEHNKHLF